MGLSAGRSIFKKQIDTYSAPGTGVIVDTSTTPLHNFTFLVTTTGVVSAWIVVLEGSIDGINFSTIATHTNLIGANVAVFPGVNVTPCLYFRTRCTSIGLGLGTSIKATVLGAR